MGYRILFFGALTLWLGLSIAWCSPRPSLTLYYDASSEDEEERPRKRSLASFSQENTTPSLGMNGAGYTPTSISSAVPDDILKLILSFVDQNTFFSMGCWSKSCQNLQSSCALLRTLDVPCMVKTNPTRMADGSMKLIRQPSLPQRIANVEAKNLFFQGITFSCQDLGLFFDEEVTDLPAFAVPYIKKNPFLQKMIFVGRPFYGIDDPFHPVPFFPEAYRGGVLDLLAECGSATLQDLSLGTQTEPFPMDGIAHWESLRHALADLEARFPHLQSLSLYLLPKTLSPDVPVLDLKVFLAPLRSSKIQLTFGLTFEPRPGFGFNFAFQTLLIQQLRDCLSHIQFHGLHLRLRPWDQDLEADIPLFFQGLAGQRNLRALSFVMMKRDVALTPPLAPLLHALIQCQNLTYLRVSLGWLLKEVRPEEARNFCSALTHSALRTLEITDDLPPHQLAVLGRTLLPFLNETRHVISYMAQGQNMAVVEPTLRLLDAVRTYGLDSSVLFQSGWGHSASDALHDLAMRWGGLFQGTYQKENHIPQAALFIRSSRSSGV
ncbi:MAG: hypothetical protein ACK5O7_00995 [Holosporales bacterium]